MKLSKILESGRLLGFSVAAALVFAFPVGSALPAPAGQAAGSDVTSALRDLRRAVASGDLTLLDESLEALIRIGGERPMKVILQYAARMPRSEDQLYWGLLRGAASFVDEKALKELGSFVVSRRRLPIARDLLHALGRNRSPNLVAALAPVIEKGNEELKVLAARRIGRIPVPEAVDVLIETLEREVSKRRDAPSELALEAAAALTQLTGQDYGLSAANWRGWWSRHRDAPLGRGLKTDRVTGTAVDYLDRRRREEFIGLEKAPPRRVIVLSAHFRRKAQLDVNNDHIEAVLQRMGIPHEVVSREDFLDFDLSDTGAVVINCAQMFEFCICPDCKPGGGVNNRLRRCTGCNRHIKFSAALTPPQIEKLKNFVLQGGYVFCEDWVVKEFVEKAFPEFVAAGKKLTESRVDVVPARGMASHPYLRGIFAADAPAAGSDFEDEGPTIVVGPKDPADAKLLEIRHRWKIDDESFALRVLNPRRVVTLLTSGELQKRADGHGAVAVAFRPGSGRKANVPPGHRTGLRGTPGVVVAVLSHFGKQETRLDEHSLENLLLNVLIDANVAVEAREKGP